MGKNYFPGIEEGPDAEAVGVLRLGQWAAGSDQFSMKMLLCVENKWEV